MPRQLSGKPYIGLLSISMQYMMLTITAKCSRLQIFLSISY